MGNRKLTEKLVFIALLVALTVVLGFIDRYLSVALSTFVAVPGFKLGLANIIILTALYYLDFEETILLIMLKSLFTGLILGNWVTFSISFSGTILSYITMYLLIKIGKDRISLLGVSIAGSITHNIGQILIVVLYYSVASVFTLFWLIPIGIFTGIFVGNMVIVLRGYLDKGQVFKTITEKKLSNEEILSLIEEEE